MGTMAGVKAEIHSKVGAPIDEQRLSFQGQFLPDDLCLRDVVMLSPGFGEGTIVEITLLRETLVEKFEDFELKEALMRGIQGYGFEKPSKIQKLAIRPLIEGRDVIAQAQSGTGKTATYLIGSLQRIDPLMVATQALVFAPTRELACPIQAVASALGQHLRITTHACVGGDDMDILRQSPHFVVGTPGRLRDMMSNRFILLDDLKTFVLDEMDEMMSRGFRGLIFETMEMLPSSVQMAVFSATMAPDLLEHMKRILRDPVRIQTKKDSDLTLEGIRQFYVAIEREEYKLDTLCDMMQTLSLSSTVIFCNTRRKVVWLAQRLAEQGFAPVSIMHADLDQVERDLVVREMSSGSSRILISTDLHTKSADLQQVPVVINYDLPCNVENYLIRTGRSERFDRKGVAINCVTNNDVRSLQDIERHYHTQIEELPMDISDMI